MPVCKECQSFFPIPENEGFLDYEPGKGDCVKEVIDAKCRYWTSRPVREDEEACPDFKLRKK